MSLTTPLSSQINLADIDSSDFVLQTQVNSIQSNLDAYSAQANSSFSSGGGSGGFTEGFLLSDGIKIIPSANANSAYATSNIISLSTTISSGNNILVYLEGLLQHPDTYVISNSTLQFSNVEPIPAGITVGIRYLKASNVVVDSESANALIGANGMLAWDYESKRLRVYNGSTIGGFFATATPTTTIVFQGSVSGYTSGGGNPGHLNTIDKFSLISNTNATDVGDLTQSRNASTGQSSTISGYTSGGLLVPPGSPRQNTIDKFPFAANANATDVGDLTAARQSSGSQSSNKSGYTSSGYTSVNVNTIDKFSFAADGNAADVGDSTIAAHWRAGQSSYTEGYISGGNPVSNVIEKFPFSTDANASDVGDLTLSRIGPAGQSSSTSGYTSAGGSPTASNVIDKFPFAANSNATDVGDLTQATQYATGQSSVVSGYTSGGFGPTFTNIIDKFPFASNANATDVGDLTQGRYASAGQQV
jgi:hypothetical protein